MMPLKLFAQWTFLAEFFAEFWVVRKVDQQKLGLISTCLATRYLCWFSPFSSWNIAHIYHACSSKSRVYNGPQVWSNWGLPEILHIHTMPAAPGWFYDASQYDQIKLRMQWIWKLQNSKGKENFNLLRLTFTMAGKQNGNTKRLNLGHTYGNCPWPKQLMDGSFCLVTSECICEAGGVSRGAQLQCCYHCQCCW